MFYTLSSQTIEMNRQFYRTMVDPTHPLLALGRSMNWSFILQEVSKYYVQTKVGRPTVDLFVLLKILLIQAFVPYVLRVAKFIRMSLIVGF